MLKRISFSAALVALLLWWGPVSLYGQTTGDAADVQDSEQGQLTVAVREVPPFATRDSAGNWEGLSVALWQDVADRLNINFQWRDLALEQTWEGLARGEVDAAIAALSVTVERERDFDFSHPYHIAGLAPAYRSSDGNAWTNTFKAFLTLEFLSTVGSLSLVLLGAGFLIWLFERKSNEEFGGNSVVKGLGDGFWWSAVTMTTVGYGDKSPRTLGGRIVGLIWMFMSLIIIASFTGSIAASLTTNQLSNDALRSTPIADLRVGVLRDSVGASYAQGVGARTQVFDSLDDALAALREERVDTVIHDAPILKYRVREAFPDLEVPSRILVRDDYAFVFAGSSALREEINSALLSIIHEPVWQDIKRRFLGADDIL